MNKETVIIEKIDVDFVKLIDPEGEVDVAKTYEWLLNSSGVQMTDDVRRQIKNQLRVEKLKKLK